MDAVSFLKDFHPDRGWFLTAIDQNGGGLESRRFDSNTEAEARRWVDEHNGNRNLYFSINVPRPGVVTKAKREDIELVPYLHVDADARVGEPLEEELERILALLTTNRPPGIPPATFIVFSGNGFWAFWKLKEPVSINGDLSVADDLARYNTRLEEAFAADSCHNIDRIARLPRTWNIPDRKKRERGRKRTMATVHSYEAGNAYTLSEFGPVPTIEPVNIDVTVSVREVERLDSVDDLDKWGVPDRVKAVIVQGHDPDKPKKGDNSRSAWLFDAVCQLARYGVPDDVIYAVITDPRFGVSESVLEKVGKDREYAERQIERAKKTVCEDKPILSKSTPLVSARRFLSTRRPTLMHYNGDWFCFELVAYTDLEEATVRSEVYEFLDKALQPVDSGELQPFSPTSAKVSNVIDALMARAHRPRDMFAPPCWLAGGTLAPKEIVACQNGLLHLLTGELHESTPDFFTRNALEFAYDSKAAPAERWVEFLEDLWPEDHGTIEVLQEIFGYLLIPDTSQQKIFMLIGPARSGKGTIARVLTSLVGRHNTCAPTLKTMGGTFGLQPLIGKQLAIISDLRLGPKTDQAAVSENLLRISGEDMVTVNRKYKPEWSGRLAVRFLIMTNELPRFMDASGAVASRFVPLVMTKNFLGRENLGLINGLLRELPGILNWSIEGWRRLQDRGHFVLPAASEDSIQSLAGLASPQVAFIRDMCEFDPEAVVAKSVIYTEWKRWCEDCEVRPGSMEVFSNRLLAAGGGRVDTCKPREGQGRVPSYRGIRLQ